MSWGWECGDQVNSINPVFETIYTEHYRGRTSTGVSSTFTQNVSMVRTANGRWTVTFNTPHPDGANYTPHVVAEEQSNLRDTPDITIVQGSQTANGFSVQITTGDNSGTADVYVNTPWSFGVTSPIQVITEV